MRIQVVHCHPLEDSFNHALFRAAVETLRAAGHEVVATDLHREGFQPAMTEGERRSYLGNGYGYDDSRIARYAEILKSVEGVRCAPTAFRVSGWRITIWIVPLSSRAAPIWTE